MLHPSSNPTHTWSFYQVITLSPQTFTSQMSAAFPKSTTDAHWNITCHNVSFNFDNINHLLIRGLKFVGCGNNRVLSVKNFTVKNSTFVGQWRSGTALDITQTDTTIENSQFLSNTVGSCQIDPVSYLNYST